MSPRPVFCFVLRRNTRSLHEMEIEPVAVVTVLHDVPFAIAGDVLHELVVREVVAEGIADYADHERVTDHEYVPRTSLWWKTEDVVVDSDGCHPRHRIEFSHHRASREVRVKVCVAEFLVCLGKPVADGVAVPPGELWDGNCRRVAGEVRHAAGRLLGTEAIRVDHHVELRMSELYTTLVRLPKTYRSQVACEVVRCPLRLCVSEPGDCGQGFRPL